MFVKSRLGMLLVAGGASVALLLSACGSSGSPANAAPGKGAPAQTPAGGTAVTVKLGESDSSNMYMALSQSSVPAGTVTFTVVNEGNKTHEFVVLDTPKLANELSVKDDEAEEPGDVGEAEDIAPGETKTLTLTLHSGHYALICNLTGHFRMGMLADLQVA